MNKPRGWVGGLIRAALLVDCIVVSALALVWWFAGGRALTLLGDELLVSGVGLLALGAVTFRRCFYRVPIAYDDEPFNSGPDRKQNWSLTLLLGLAALLLLTCGSMFRLSGW